MQKITNLGIERRIVSFVRWREELKYPPYSISFVVASRSISTQIALTELKEGGEHIIDFTLLL